MLDLWVRAEHGGKVGAQLSLAFLFPGLFLGAQVLAVLPKGLLALLWLRNSAPVGVLYTSTHGLRPRPVGLRLHLLEHLHKGSLGLLGAGELQLAAHGDVDVGPVLVVALAVAVAVAVMIAAVGAVLVALGTAVVVRQLVRRRPSNPAGRARWGALGRLACLVLVDVGLDGVGDLPCRFARLGVVEIALALGGEMDGPPGARDCALEGEESESAYVGTASRVY